MACEGAKATRKRRAPGPGAGRQIAFEFSVFDERGELLGRSDPGRARIFEVGAGEMLPALERELSEMAEGERRTLVLEPADAYGPVEPEAFREFPLQSIPEPARQIGRKVVGRAPDGSEDVFDVVDVRENSVVVDMNHPLAGRTLRFEIRVLRSRPAAPADQ